MTLQTVTARSRYEQLKSKRDPYLRRARECAALTIPSLFPPDGSDGEDLPVPYCAATARGVNNLASKLTLAILPPGSPFFRLRLSDEVIEELEQSAPADESGEEDDIRGMLEEGLARAERRITNAVESYGVRIQMYESMRQLIVAGNVLVHQLQKGAIRFFRLDSYVAVWDGEGNPLEIVVHEQLDRLTAPAKVLAALPQRNPGDEQKEATDRDTLDIYTRIVRRDDKWEEWQEVEGNKIEDTDGSYPLEKCPWLPLRFMRPTRGTYGRSYCEENIGDLKVLDALSKAIVDFAGVASRIIYLLKEGGITNIEDLVAAVSGDVIYGDKEEVGALQLDKYADFQVVANSAEKVEQRIAASFLLNSSVQRKAERVTAEEIRYVINELETALGGIYSILAQEIQLPLANLLLAQAMRDGDIPRLPNGSYQPQIVTGLQALGRSAEGIRLAQAVAGLSQLFGPEVVAQHIDVSAYITRAFTAADIETKGLVIPDEIVQQRRQQQMQAELVGKLGPEALRQNGLQQGAQATPTPTP